MIKLISFTRLFPYLHRQKFHPSIHSSSRNPFHKKKTDDADRTSNNNHRHRERTEQCGKPGKPLGRINQQKTKLLQQRGRWGPTRKSSSESESMPVSSTSPRELCVYGCVGVNISWERVMRSFQFPPPDSLKTPKLSLRPVLSILSCVTSFLHLNQSIIKQ